MNTIRASSPQYISCRTLSTRAVALAPLREERGEAPQRRGSRCRPTICRPRMECLSDRPLSTFRGHTSMASQNGPCSRACLANLGLPAPVTQVPFGKTLIMMRSKQTDSRGSGPSHVSFITTSATSPQSYTVTTLHPRARMSTSTGLKRSLPLALNLISEASSELVVPLIAKTRS